MPKRSADAVWEGDLKTGKGTVKVESGAFEKPYSFTSRFEAGAGTNPEELVAAAHAGCFSMALANNLATAGHPAQRIKTTAVVHLEKGDAGFGIPRIDLVCEATVPGIDDAGFAQQAEKTKTTCPISKLLAAAQITLDAKLLKG